MRSLRALVIAVVAATLVVAVPTAAAAVRLTLPVGSLPGWHATGVSLRIGRLDLAAGLPRRLVAAIDGATVQSSAATGKNGRLRSDAFVFGSASAARRVLSGVAARPSRNDRARRRDQLPVRARDKERKHGGLAQRRADRRDRAQALASGTSGSAATALRYAVLAEGWLDFATARHPMGQGP